MRAITFVIMLLGATLAGCTSSGPNARTFAHLRLQNVSQEEAFDATARAIGERFQLDRLDRDEGSISTIPVTGTEVGNRNQVGDLIGIPRRVRTLATAVINTSQGTTNIWCKVLVQRNETHEQMIYSDDCAIDDVPRATAADRGGASTPEQNEVWRTIRRDKRIERAILQSVSEFLNLQADLDVSND